LSNAAINRAITRRKPIGDELEILGGEVLHVLADLLSDPSLVESLSLYLGSEIQSIPLLRLSLGEAYEEYTIDTVGQLVNMWQSTRWDLPDGVLPPTKRIVLRSSSDFRGLSIESVSALHRVVTREDFLDRLAWRMGREGKPGYRSWGYEEERDTWKVKSADPDELPRRRRRASVEA
jgi:hypothetical protein